MNFHLFFGFLFAFTFRVDYEIELELDLECDFGTVHVKYDVDFNFIEMDKLTVIKMLEWGIK